MKKITIFIFAALLLMGIGAVPANAGGTVAAAPKVAAAATYWQAGSITADTNYGGDMTTITFTQAGYCNSSGYYVNLNNLSGDWDARITTLYSAYEPNGCNRVKIYCKNGREYSYTTSAIFYARSGRGVDVPTNCNDSINGIRWYRV